MYLEPHTLIIATKNIWDGGGEYFKQENALHHYWDGDILKVICKYDDIAVIKEFHREFEGGIVAIWAAPFKG